MPKRPSEDYKRLVELTRIGDRDAAEILLNEASHRDDIPNSLLAATNLDWTELHERASTNAPDLIRFNTTLEILTSQNANNVENLRIANLPEGLIPPDQLKCLTKIEDRFFDVENGGFVEIVSERGLNDYNRNLISNRTTMNCIDQNRTEIDSILKLNETSPVWQNLTWPAVLQKLLEKREFNLEEDKTEIGSMLQYASKMVWGADAVGYYDMRKNKDEKITSAKDFEFLFIDGAKEFEENGERVLVREITIFYEKPDGTTGEIRPDMSQAEMIRFMGSTNPNDNNWTTSDLIAEIERRKGWQFCDYDGIRKSIKPPYQLPKDKNYVGRVGIMEDLGAAEAVYNNTNFIRGRNREEYQEAVLTNKSLSNRNEIRVVRFNPTSGLTHIHRGRAKERHSIRGAIRMLRG